MTCFEFSRFLGVILLALISACGSTLQDLTYRCEETIGSYCDTGSHSFKSKEELCAGLQSATLNHGCALSCRKENFKTFGCPGTFTEMP